jgi:hypothetical protein
MSHRKFGNISLATIDARSFACCVPSAQALSHRRNCIAVRREYARELGMAEERVR